MLKAIRFVLCALILTLAGTSVQAKEKRDRDSLADWSREHAAAKDELIRILSNHTKAGPDLIKWESNNPGQFREFVDFLVDKKSNSVEEFTEKKGKDATADLRELRKERTDCVVRLRDWIKSNPVSAQSLAKHRGVFKAFCAEAESEKKRK